MKIVFSIASGGLFALGLVVSGMTQPLKVLGFLNIGGIFAPDRFGPWDPSLAFVMGGAVLVSSIAFSRTPNAIKKPWFAEGFSLPNKSDIDVKLLLGAVLFGIGWGLVGYCPGPAFATLFSGGLDVLLFCGFLLSGMWLAKRFVS
jgi:uncharacterized protein